MTTRTQLYALQNSLKFSTSKTAAVIFSAEYHVISLSASEISFKLFFEDKQCHLNDEAALSPLEFTRRLLDKDLLEQRTMSEN